jgi:lysophospholipase L1-like esterase
MHKLLPLILLLVVAAAPAQPTPPKQNLNIVFIGNSITYGGGLATPATEAPPVQAAAYLRQQKNTNQVAYANLGVSGYTTVDFLPATNKIFNKVLQTANAFKGQPGLLLFSIDLGTNDSAVQGPNGSPVSPAAYRTNLKIITDRLLADYPGCKIIIHRPIWYSPNTYNSSKYLAEGLARLQNYFGEIDALVASYAATHPKRVFRGDTKAFDYFRKNYLTHFQHETGQQGTFYLHPNQKGAAVLGRFWGKAIYDAIR